ncbi:ABC transporter permease [Natronospora cellulosivora (SeqCode)]
MNEIIDISLIQLITAYIFVLILLFIIKKENISNEWQIIISTFRMTIQLVLVGFVLTYIFDNPSIFLSLLILLLMEIFAIQNIYSRIDKKLSINLKKVIAIAIFIGTSISLFYFILIVINLKPWYQPQYFIPLAGMLIGNSMTGISLGIEGLISGIKDNTQMIENALMLGGKPKIIIKGISSRAFYNAILPTINSMLGMGIVFLPGMMTGQILAGAAPMIAIKYQIAIMLGILGSVTLSVYLMIKWGAKSFFNDRAQLEIDL